MKGSLKLRRMKVMDLILRVVLSENELVERRELVLMVLREGIILDKVIVFFYNRIL